MKFREFDTNKPAILLVDDDYRIRSLLSRYLWNDGFIALTAGDAGEARNMLEIICFDMLILDRMMPEEDGLSLAGSIRQKSDVPIIMLTALGESQNRIDGLEAGADDYLPKPFEPKELVLRIQSILKRRPQKTGTLNDSPVKIGRWAFDPHGHILEDSQDRIMLTTAEATLLRHMISQPNTTVDRYMLGEIFGLQPDSRAIDVQVTRLRKKIEDDPKFPKLIQTVRGQGYLLRMETGL